MKSTKAIELMERYARCENCGSDRIGNGAGGLLIIDNTFTRTCECGWNIQITGVDTDETNG